MSMGALSVFLTVCWHTVQKQFSSGYINAHNLRHAAGQPVIFLDTTQVCQCEADVSMCTYRGGVCLSRLRERERKVVCVRERKRQCCCIFYDRNCTFTKSSDRGDRRNSVLKRRVKFWAVRSSSIKANFK